MKRRKITTHKGDLDEVEKSCSGIKRWLLECVVLVASGCLTLCIEKPAAAAAKSLQTCPTLCDTIDRSPPGSPVPGTLQARTLEWVAISFSNAWKWKVKVKSLSHVRLLGTSWAEPNSCPPGTFSLRSLYWQKHMGKILAKCYSVHFEMKFCSCPHLPQSGWYTR